MKTKLVFIEDEQEKIKVALDYFKDKSDEYEVEISSFSDSERVVKEQNPAIVMLDLLEGEDPDVWPDVFDILWKDRFYPIIIFSAITKVFIESAISEKDQNNPFIAVVEKGPDCELELERTIKEFLTKLPAIKAAEKEILAVYGHSLRVAAPWAGRSVSSESEFHKALFRLSRRVLSAKFDVPNEQGEKPESWELYISPKISSCTLLGDVLKIKDTNTLDPTAYRIVLTPSCDMASSESQNPKVKKVLVACCIPMNEARKKVGFNSPTESTVRSKMLNTGYCQTIVPFPELKGEIPLMAADMQSLDLIPIEEIGPKGCTFVRIASVDNPFREMISVAYMSSAGKVGLPDRELDEWIKGIRTA